MIKQKKNIGTCWDKKEKAILEKITIQFEEINQKVMEKERRLKRYRQRVNQYRQNRIFQNNEKKFYQKVGEMTRKHTNNQMQEKLNNFVVKYGNQENIKNHMDKQHGKRVTRT